MKAILSFVSIFQDSYHWGWKLIIGLLGLVAGILLLNHPWWGKLLLPAVAVIVIAIMAIVMGVVSLIQAVTGSGWADAILGLLAIFLGFLLLSQPIGFTLISQPLIATVALPYLFGYLMVGGGLLAILGSLAMFIRGVTKKPVEAAVEPAGEAVRLEEAPIQITDTRPVVTTAAVVGAAMEMGDEESVQPEEILESPESPEQADIGWALEEESKEEEKPSFEPGPAILVGAGALVADALQEDQEEPVAESVEEAVELQELVESEGMSPEALVAAKLAADELGSDEPAVVPVAESLVDSVDEAVVEAAIVEEITSDESETAEPVLPESEKGEVLQEDGLQPGEIELADVQKRLLNHDVEFMEGIGPVYAAKLKAIGIATALDLLRQGATRRGRMDIVDKSGISQKLVIKWINQADMYRIKGIGSEYAELLEAAGVDTVVELAARRPDNLHPTLQETNDLKKLTRQAPSLNQVKDWIEQAKNLPRVIRY